MGYREAARVLHQQNSSRFPVSDQQRRPLT